MNYKMITKMTDTGPFISKLIVKLPGTVFSNEVSTDSFNVYAEQKKQDEILYQGYATVTDVYACDECGVMKAHGEYMALELKEERLGKRTKGSVTVSAWLDSYYRITQIEEIRCGDKMISGLVFDKLEDDIFPEIKGWSDHKFQYGSIEMNYSYFTPDFEEIRKPKRDFYGDLCPTIGDKIPVVVWLHGGGEGGTNPKIAYTGNKVTALSSEDIQKKLGGAAYVLTPQSPTYWMDDGVEQLGKSNQSIYTEAVMELVKAFVKEHQETVDMKRIYLGGLSNGGFLTIRLLVDYPGYFAGAIAACAPFYDMNMTDELLENLKAVPLWFVHAKNDELVNPEKTSLPIYYRLKNTGAENVHFTYFDKVVDLSGKYKNEDGTPLRYFNHGVWVHVYNDDCITDIDGSRVMENGIPVTLWEWLGCQKK